MTNSPTRASFWRGRKPWVNNLLTIYQHNQLGGNGGRSIEIGSGGRSSALLEGLDDPAAPAVDPVADMDGPVEPLRAAGTTPARPIGIPDDPRDTGSSPDVRLASPVARDPVPAIVGTLAGLLSFRV